jgi:outer membrane protein OmpA-like peptidoglycan-associated protein
MIRSLILIFLFLISIRAIAQEVQWVSRVIDYSSELSEKEYSAQQVLGKPDVLPQGGDSPNAWMPLNPNKSEYIKVWFDQPIHIQQIVIAESFNPSATYQIYAYGREGKEYLLNTFSPGPIPQKGRLLHVFIERTVYEVTSLKLVLDGLSVPGYNGIDAIGISDSKIPVEVEIHRAENVSEKLNAQKLSESINSEYKEIRPILTPDGKTIYFSRMNHPENIGGTDDPEDIWYSEYNMNIEDWLDAINPGQPLNNSGANYVSSITPDGKSLTVMLGNRYHKNKNMKPGVSVTTLNSNGWTDPVPVNINNAFIENNDGHYFLAQSRESMIISVNRFDAYGRKDIYVTFILPDGSWSEPLNLGNTINTSSDENSPFLAADNKTLYFSSKGYSGYGGYDVYVSRRLDESWKNWSEPENLGSQINTEEDEIFFTIPPAGEHAYYSKSDSEYDADIYRIHLPLFFQPEPIALMRGHIYKEGTREPVPARIQYEVFPDETGIGYTNSDPGTGDFEIVFPLGSNYKYIIDIDGVVLYEDTVTLIDQDKYKEIERDIFINPDILSEAMASAAVLAGDAEALKEKPNEEEVPVIEINDGVLAISVHFNFDSDVIWKSSYTHLDRIVNLLRSTPVNIILAGHTDTTGVGIYNQGLSERRAESVYQYFVGKGIDPEKIKTVGYGESRPLTSNSTKEGRRRNRRVEFIRADEMEKYDQKYEQ